MSGADLRQGDETSLLTAAAVFLRYRRLVVAFAAAGAVTGLAIALLLPARFVSTFSFLPQSSSNSPTASALASLSGQLGINIGGSGGLRDSPEFYEELARSRPVLERLARDSVWGTSAGSLADLFGMRTASPGADVEAVIRHLRTEVLRVDSRRGIVEVRVTTGSPETAHLIATRTLAYIEEFTVQRKQSRATAERRFVEDRLAVVRAGLDSAEAALWEFLSRNRRYQGAPTLEAMHDRLQRQVTLQQQLYAALLQQHEQTRIDEVRNTPVIAVIDDPNLPMKPESRHAVFAVAAGLVAGALFGSFAAFSAQNASEMRARQAVAARDLDALWLETRSEVRHLLSPRSGKPS